MNVSTDGATSKKQDEVLVEEPLDLGDDEPATKDQNSGAADPPNDVTPAETVEASRETMDHVPEPEVARQAEAETPAPQPAQEKVVERVIEKRGGFLPALLGGIAAAFVGFLVGRGDVLDAYLPRWMKGSEATAAEQNAETIAALQSQLTALSDQIAAEAPIDLNPIETRLAELGAKVDPLGALIGSIETRLGDLDNRVAPLGADIADLSARMPMLVERIDVLEKRPVTDVLPEQAVAVYERELAQMGQSLADQRAEFDKIVATQKDELAAAVLAQKSEFEKTLAEVQAREANAEASAKLAAAGTALAQLRSALDNGAPYAAQIDTIAGAGFDVPADLSADADAGIATMSTLRNGFPTAAREALATVRAEVGGAAGDIGGFLARQLGVRSVTPRAGDDPDAILSRAEAALTAGQLEQTLTELATLPESAKSAMTTWIAQAQARHTAVTAADTLSADINTN